MARKRSKSYLVVGNVVGSVAIMVIVVWTLQSIQRTDALGLDKLVFPNITVFINPFLCVLQLLE